MSIISFLLLMALLFLVIAFPILVIEIALEGPVAFITTQLEHMHYKARRRLAKDASKDKIVNGTKWTRFLENKLKKYKLKNEFNNINTSLAYAKYYSGELLLDKEDYKSYYEDKGWTVSFTETRVIIE